MTYVIRIRVVSLFFLLPFFLIAQPADTAGVTSTAIARLKEVVVQATRVSAKSPIPHSNLNAVKIAKTLQAQDVPFLLSRTPSVVETSDAGTGIGYTGLRIRGSDPTRVNVTINGVPFNDAESQGVFWVDLPDLAASAAEIQVQRGVGSSTNGAGAFGATVNIDLSKVSPVPVASVMGTVGAFGSRKFSAQMATGLLSDKWSFSGRASTIHSDGYIDRATADLRSIHLSAAYLGEQQTLQAHLLTGHEITYQAWNGAPAQLIDNKSLRTYNSAGTERPAEPHKNEVDDYTQRHLLLHYKRTLTPNLILQLNGHYTRGFGYYEQYKADQSYEDYGLQPWTIGDTTISATNLIRRRWLDNDFYGGTFALRWTGGEKKDAVLLLGGGINQYDGRHFGAIVWSEKPIGVQEGFKYYNNTAVKQDANLYLKAERAFGGRFTAFAELQGRGLKYQFLGFNNDQTLTDQTVHHFFFNPKAGATYTFSTHWTTYAFVGVAHREPNRDDYTQSSPNSRPLPEQLQDAEFGLRFETGKATASANFFFMQYRNQLVLDGRINDVGNYIRTNVPNSNRGGVELESTGQLGNRISLAGNLTLSRNKIVKFTEYLDNWDTESQEIVTHQRPDLAFSPTIISSGEATCLWWGQPETGSGLPSHVRKGRISTTISGKYVGKQYLDNTSSEKAALPGYFVSDLRLNVEWSNVVGKKLSLLLALNNWLDARYSSNGWVYRYISAGYDARPDNLYTRLEGGNVYQQAGYFPQAGRHLMGTLRIDF